MVCFLNYTPKYKSDKNPVLIEVNADEERLSVEIVALHTSHNLRWIILVLFGIDTISLVNRILSVKRFCVMFYDVCFSMRYTPNDWEKIITFISFLNLKLLSFFLNLIIREIKIIFVILYV
jgi:hypothetical protein